MVLPLILSALGSAAAGAGLVSMSPLLAGALGTGVGTALQTGDLEKGILAGLGGAAGGAVLGNMMGGAGASAATDAATAAATSGAPAAAPGGFMNSMLPGGPGLSPTVDPMLTGETFGERIGQIGAETAGKTPMMDVLKEGFTQGTLTGGGAGAALTAPMFMPETQMRDMERTRRRGRGRYPEGPAANREQYAPRRGYRPGYDPEPLYFDPRMPRASVNFSGGGIVQPVQLAGGGLADMGGEAAFQSLPPPEVEQGGGNERELISAAIRAVRNEMPEEQAAMVLGEFVQLFGEDALRRLVDDVQSGALTAGDVEGQVRGPGDGMDDRVPAQMDDGSSDILLSDGEFIVPADVVSGLGNGSTEAGAAELEDMASRVRQTRTGRAAQPKQIKAGGMLPA